MNTENTFRVWIQKDVLENECAGFREEIGKVIETLKSKYRFTDGSLSHKPAWVFYFPDAETAYDLEMGVLLEIGHKYGHDYGVNTECYFSFEDCFNNWRQHKNRFIADPKNANCHFYQIWKENDEA